MYQCKRCEYTGNALSLFSILNLNTQVSTPTLEEIKNEIAGEGERDQERPESVLPRSCVSAWNHPRARRYLQQRKLSERDVERYGLLYCPRGYFRKRLIIPVFDKRGDYKTFSARYIGGSHLPEIRKYLYPKGATLSKLLGGIHSYKTKKRERFVIIVEGMFDYFHTVPYGVCCFGTNLSDRQVDLLRDAGIKRVVLCWDSDKKRIARKNVQRSIKRAKSKLLKYFQVGIINLPKIPSDPTDYPKEQIFKWAKESLS